MQTASEDVRWEQHFCLTYLYFIGLDAAGERKHLMIFLM